MVQKYGTCTSNPMITVAFWSTKLIFSQGDARDWRLVDTNSHSLSVIPEVRAGLLSLADSIRLFQSGHFSVSCFGLAVLVGLFWSQDISVWGHFSRDISVHKQLITFVCW